MCVCVCVCVCVCAFTLILSLSLSLITVEVEIVIQPDDGEYREGNTVIFSCVASGSPNPDHIAWNRGGEMIPFDNNNGSSNVRIYTELIEVGGMYFVVSNLEICGISPDDGGLYSCSAVLDSGLSATSDDFWVNVTAARRESKSSRKKQLAKFSPRSITCVCVYRTVPSCLLVLPYPLSVLLTPHLSGCTEAVLSHGFRVRAPLYVII